MLRYSQLFHGYKRQQWQKAGGNDALLMQIARNRNLVLKKDLKKRKLKKKTLLKKKKTPTPTPTPTPSPRFTDTLPICYRLIL